MAKDLLVRPTMRSIVKAMTAQELSACAQDIISWQDKGLLADGSLSALATRFVAETGIDEMSSLQQAEAAVLREASLRFIATQTGLRADQPLEKAGFPEVGDVVRENPGVPPVDCRAPIYSYFVAGDKRMTSDYDQAAREGTCFPTRVA